MSDRTAAPESAGKRSPDKESFGHPFHPFLTLHVASQFNQPLILSVTLNEMPLRPSLLSRWISPAELLRRPTLRAALIPSPTGTIHPNLPLLRSQAAFKPTRRSLTTAANYISRPGAHARPGLRSIQLPKQRLNRRYNSGSSSSSSQSEKEATSLSQRLRKLSREYGWAAVGVYFALSALDFPFCFAAVRLLGVERIGHFEHVVVQSAKDAFHSVWPQSETKPQDEGEGEDTQTSLVLAEERNQEEASRSICLCAYVDTV